ncbi:MAG: hypothetical protein ACOX3H_02485 [Saccharofermentanales bacterium]|jgi:hypothetical protein
MSPLDQVIKDLGLKNYDELTDFVISNPDEPISIELRSGFVKFLQLSHQPDRAGDNYETL